MNTTKDKANANRWFRQTQRASLDLQVAHADLSNWLIATIRAQCIVKDRSSTVIISEMCASLGLTSTDEVDKVIDLMHEVELAKCSYVDVAAQHPEDYRY
jgi:hypothetical protein